MLKRKQLQKHGQKTEHREAYVTMRDAGKPFTNFMSGGNDLALIVSPKIALDAGMDIGSNTCAFLKLISH